MPLRPLIASLVALGALAVPAAALAVPPVNDDYLKSTPINRADTRLPREEVKTVVDTTEGMPWSRLSPQRRQELALAGSAVGIVALLVGTIAIVRRVRRRRRA